MSIYRTLYGIVTVFCYVYIYLLFGGVLAVLMYNLLIVMFTIALTSVVSLELVVLIGLLWAILGLCSLFYSLRRSRVHYSIK